MARGNHANPSRSSRREVLKGIGIATAASLGTGLKTPALLADEPRRAAASGADRLRVSGIDPQAVVDEYARRELAAVSDADLCRQAAAIISRPPTKNNNSFTLHAPLELLARYGLLPLVDPQSRELARMQLVASAATFESVAAGSAPPGKITPFPSQTVAKDEFTRAFQQGDASALEAIVLQFAAQFGTARLVQLLTPLALPTLTGASHSHIGLWLLLRHARGSDVGDAALLRAAARALAADPQGQLTSFSGLAIESDQPLQQTPAEVEREILDKLTSPPRGQPAGGGMRGLFTAGEATGNANTLFADFIRHDLTSDQIDAGFRAVLRTCAHSMLQHGPQHAKFGWSHCLTLPQAACGLSSFNIDRKLALAASLVWITAYRSVLSDRDLDFQWTPTKLTGSASVLEALHTSPTAAAARVWHADPGERPRIKQMLATQASIRTDQHLIKYTRACLDMLSFDPEHEQLYLAAAAHLGSIWAKEQPEPKVKGKLAG